MRITGPVAPTNPFHLARAYGVAGAAPVRPVGSPGVEHAAPMRPALAASRLVAGIVPGGVSFDAPPEQGASAGRSLELYRRPADRNTAATGVGLGRVIDVSG